MKIQRIFIHYAFLMLLSVIFASLGRYGYYLSGQGYEACGAIIFGLSIVMFGWALLVALHNLTKELWLVVLLFLALCCWGIQVYYPVKWFDVDPIVKLLAPLNDTLAMFFPSRGAYDDEPFIKTASYQLLHLSAYFFFALLMFSIFGRRLINSSKRLYIQRSRKNIFWGDAPGGMLLAQDILDKTTWQEVVFVFSRDVKDEEEKEKALFNKIDSMGGIALYRDFDNMKRYPKGGRHFFLTEDQDFNLKMALKIAEKSRKSRQKTKIYLRTEMPRVDYLFDKMSNVDVHILNQSGLTARQFVKDNPLIDIVPPEKINNLTVDFDFNVLMLGFGWQGRELLHKTICDAQFKGSAFSATVIDRDLDLKRGEYKLLYDECIKEYNLRFENDEKISNVGGKHFYQWFGAHQHRFGRIIVALGDDDLNFNISFALANMLIAKGDLNPEKRIFVHISNKDKYAYDEKADKKTDADECQYPVKMFGRLDRIYTAEIVIAEKMDKIAKAVNYVYDNYKIPFLPEINLKKEDEKNWHKKTTFDKESSRAAALNVDNIIKISEGRDRFEEAVKNPEALEILAENEHLRWNAFHLTQGVRRWVHIADNNPTNAKLFKNPGKKAWLMKHACLVPYNDLDRISDRVNEINKPSKEEDKEDFKESDRRIIRHFGLFYDELHKK